MHRDRTLQGSGCNDHVSRITDQSSRHDLSPRFVPYGNGVDRTRVAGAEKLFAVHLAWLYEDDDALVIQAECLTGFCYAVAKPDAKLAVDAHAQPMNLAFFFVGHSESAGGVGSRSDDIAAKHSET